MRISDWSSDVCSSDLLLDAPEGAKARPEARGADGGGALGDQEPQVAGELAGEVVAVAEQHGEIGIGLQPRRQRLAGHDLHVDTGIGPAEIRSEEHTSELQSLMRISYAVFCLKKKNTQPTTHSHQTQQHQQDNTTNHNS